MVAGSLSLPEFAIAEESPLVSQSQIADRVSAVLERTVPILADGGDALLVAHGHVLRVLAATWLGLPPADGALLALSTGSLSTLGFEHERHVLTGWNAQPQ